MRNGTIGPAVSVADGVSGSLMGRTLAYLAALLAILSAAVLVAPVSAWSMWAGVGMALLGTWLVGRNVWRPARAFFWGAVVAVGMGFLVAPLVQSLLVSDPSLLVNSLAALLVAVLFAALVASWVPWDFSRLMPLLFIGLMMLIVVGMLSWFIPAVSGLALSSGFAWLGTIIFIGYLVVDFSLMRARGRVMPAQGTAVMLAVSLLIDIVNLFMFLTRLGRR